MLQLTKIFHFEMAHAIHGYSGSCKNIHGHSYELHVTVSSRGRTDEYIPTPGFIIDFKEIKAMVKSSVIGYFDHKLLLSQAFIAGHPTFSKQENLVIWEWEPTAENILIYMKQKLDEHFMDKIQLVHLKLYETKDSYVEWINDNRLTGKTIG